MLFELITMPFDLHVITYVKGVPEVGPFGCQVKYRSAGPLHSASIETLHISFTAL